MHQLDRASYPTARSLALDVAERRVSSVELAESAIARIAAYDATLNAVVVRDFERAMSIAKAADAANARGKRKPLLGVPITVKESFNIAGLPTTWGMPWFRDYRAREDAVAIARLKAAGAVILGKTNVPFALGDYQSYNEIYGTTNNPWALDRTPGGSSGGSAVSLAAGYVPIEMGSDLGGSLRSPAHYCGVYSHKPSRGVVPGRGHLVPGSSGNTPDLAVVGPLARNVDDLRLAFEIVAGPDVIEAAGMRLSLPPSRKDRLSDFRVLVLVDGHPLLPADEAVSGALEKLAERLRSAGAKVSENRAVVPDLVELGRAFVTLIMPVVFARQPEERLSAIRDQIAGMPPDADSPDAWALRGAVATHREWLAADEVRVRMAHQWHELFRHFDVVLFPPMATPAFVQDQGDFRTRTIDIDGFPYPYDNQIFYASVATALGLPVTTVPIDRTADGLPVGVQVIGPFLEDATTLRFAELLEDVFGGFSPPPGYE